MLYILSGPDNFSRTRVLDNIKSGIGDPETLATNTTILEGQQLTIDQLRPVCEAAPFLAEKRLVVITGLLQRFEPNRRPRRQTRGRRTTTSSEDYKLLGQYILTIPESTIMVLLDDDIKAGNPLLKIFSGKAQVQSFPLLRPADLRPWVQERVRKEGGSISPQALNLLVKLVGSDLWIMSSEIEKLLLYSAGRRIEEEDINLVVGYTQQVNIFAMVDAIVEFRTQAAEKLLQQFLQQGSSPSHLLAMLARQMRLIVRAKDVDNPRISGSELRNRLGIPNEYAARKTLEQANRYSLPRIRYVYRQLLETDLAIKTSKYEPELALSILVTELCQQRPVQTDHALR
ncbi:MAG: DNA polymerase III subunit delta [Dehalococcoidia bacterium]|nr:DNA polymerase III subunit delta [Dehalococcoidia bacterium]MBL7165453.1 DNA polymerase III subunit delta [Dehalococcoidales bacterium]